MRQADTLRKLYDKTKTRAEVRGHSWGLSTAEFKALVKQPCHYCGLAPSATFRCVVRKKESSCVVNGLDRADNTKGYSVQNCVASCRRCNVAKADMTPDQFREWATRVVHFFSGPSPG